MNNKNIKNFLVIDGTQDKIKFFSSFNNISYNKSFETSKNNNDKFSTLLFDFFNENNIKLSEINSIFVNQGPGKFSGIRTSIAVAKALSKMKEVRFVSTLIGRHDLMAFVLAKDINILSKVLYEDISSLPGVRFSESSIGLKYYKYDYRWARILD